jgi:flagellar biosynthesis/type III secretory pathway M-ring protein FliF/YscJ
MRLLHPSGFFAGACAAPLKLPAICFIACLALAASVAGSKLVPQYECVSRVASREMQLDLQMQDKGEQLLSAITGAPAHVTVSARCGVGMRKQEWHYFPDANSRGGYAVDALQEKSEKSNKLSSGASSDEAGKQASPPSACGSDQNCARSEKREYTRLDQTSQEGFWTERVSVCAVVDRGDVAKLEEALRTGLGLESVRGDSVCVIVRTR